VKVLGAARFPLVAVFESRQGVCLDVTHIHAEFFEGPPALERAGCREEDLASQLRACSRQEEGEVLQGHLKPEQRYKWTLT
jgi:hypothetical protein